MSPEQAAGDRVLDGRRDVYALGAVTYEMLVGDPPHDAGSVQAIIAKVLTEKPAPVRSRRDTVPPHVDGAIMKALAKLPADRFATAGELSTALVNPRPELVAVSDTLAHAKAAPSRRRTMAKRL
jgi:serine/threonine-protein kinase